MELVKWVWAILALLFFIAEIFTAGFFLICFGVGATAASVLAFAGFEPIWQMGGFVIGSAVSLILIRPFANRVSSHEPNVVGIDRVLDKQGIVIEAIDPVSAKGRVRVDREEWQAESVDRQPIAAGITVFVLGVNGTKLKVRKDEVKSSA